MNDQLAARIPVSRNGVGLDVTMLDRRQRVRVLDDLVRFSKPLLDIAANRSVDAVDVAAGQLINVPLVNNRRVRFCRFKNVGDGGQLLVVNLNERDRLFSYLPTVSGDRGNDIARVSNFVDGNDRLIFDAGAEVGIQSSKIFTRYDDANAE